MKPVLILLAFTAGLAAQQPEPVLRLSANGGAAVDLPRGWPLLVRGTITHSEISSRAADVAPVRLAPQAGAWTDAIWLSAWSAEGAAVLWNLQLIGGPAPAELSLPQRSMATLYWRMTPEETAELAEGVYRLTASLSVDGSAGWNGTVRPAPLTIRVVPAPASPTPEEVERLALLKLDLAVLEDRLDDADRESDAWLEAQPESYQAFQARALLFERRGMPQEALACALNAWNQYLKQVPGPRDPRHPLPQLVERLRKQVDGMQ